MFLFVSIFFFVSVVPFFSPNTAGATAAARFPPQASIHFYKISCCVWVFDSKANTKTQQLKRGSHFGFSCILRDKDLWSLWDEKGKKKQKKHPMRQWSHYILSLGMGVGGFIMMSTDIFYPGDKGKGLEDRGGTGIRSHRFRQWIGHSPSLAWVNVKWSTAFERCHKRLFKC